MTRTCLVLVALFCFASIPNALATSPCPAYSYKKHSPDGRYVFIMIPPIPIAQDLESWNEETKTGIAEIRKRYVRSGLYLNDDSVDPLWTVDWYSFGVEVTSDGMYRKDEDGSTFVFDLATGDLVSVSHPGDIVWWSVLSFASAEILGCIMVIVVRRRRR